MTVTALPSRSFVPRRTPAHRRPTSVEATEDQTLTVSFVVTLTGESRFRHAAHVLDTLRGLTSRLGDAEVDVSPALALAPPASRVDILATAATEEVQVLVETREVRVGGRIVPFTRIEFDLLRFLAEHPRQVFTREQLLRHVWGFAQGGHRTVDVHIRRLRAKLGEREVATTVRGVGYRLADDAPVRVVRLGAGELTIR